MTTREPLVTPRKARLALSSPGTAVSHATKRLRAAYYDWRYEDYRTRYLAQTKSDVHDDPAGSVGPAELFEEMREWQFRFLVVDANLQRGDVFLDLGCGVLRGGLPLIDYLDTGNYYGMDLSADALDVGREAIADAGLNQKEPTLINNSDLTFQDAALPDSSDVIWAQSVLTHLPPEKLHELLEHVGGVLAEDGRFFATWYEADGDAVVERVSGIGFEYPFAYLEREAAANGLSVKRVLPTEKHPNGLETVVMTHSDEHLD